MRSRLPLFRGEINTMYFLNNHSGQAMLLTVFIVGAGILSMTAISGYLLTQRIRASSNLTDSARAIYAADAGLECERYNLKPDPNVTCTDLPFTTPGGTRLETVVDGIAETIKTTGISNNAYRAFLFSY